MFRFGFSILLRRRGVSLKKQFVYQKKILNLNLHFFTTLTFYFEDILVSYKY